MTFCVLSCASLWLFFLPVLFNIKMHAAAHDFLESDARWFVFLRIDLDSGLCSSL